LKIFILFSDFNSWEGKLRRRQITGGRAIVNVPLPSGTRSQKSEISKRAFWATISY